MCFVNKQLTYVIKIFFLLERKLPSKPALSNASFGVLEVKKCCVPSELRDFFYVQTLLYAYSGGCPAGYLSRYPALYITFQADFEQ